MRTTAKLLAVTAVVPLVVAGCSSKDKSPAAASAPSVSVRAGGAVGVGQTSLGAVLTDGHGMTLYRFAPDEMGRSTCVSSCARYWPPVPAPASTAGPGGSVTATIGSISRPDGSKQMTVEGYPVYTYVGDRSAGSTTGQGLDISGGLWWVLDPAGSEIRTAAGSGTPSSSSRSGYGGRGY